MASTSGQTSLVSARPEFELLLCCARTRLDPERVKRIGDLLRQEIDWVLLIRMAIQHGLLPLLYWNLKNVSADAVPRKTLDELRKQFAAHTRRNVSMAEELIRVLDLFEAHQIPAFPFKGPVLAMSIYGNLALRQFTDLDVFVHKRDIRRAKALLVSRQYRWLPLTQPRQASHYVMLPVIKDFVFVSEDGRTKVELHWRLTGWHFPFPLNMKRLWKHLGAVELAGSRVHNLPPEALLLYLCMHGSRHGWQRLDWICDIAELVRVYQDLDWNQVEERASTLGCKRMLCLGLLLAHDLLGAELPEEVLQTVLSDQVAASLASEINEQFLYESGGQFKVFKRELLHLRMRERLRDRIRYILFSFLSQYFYWYQKIPINEKDRALIPLPAALSFLYYLVRPVRLLREYGLRPWKLLANSLFGSSNTPI